MRRKASPSTGDACNGYVFYFQILTAITILMIFIPDMILSPYNQLGTTSLTSIQDANVHMTAVASAASTLYIFFEMLIELFTLNFSRNFTERVFLFISLNMFNFAVLSSRRIAYSSSILISLSCIQDILFSSCFFTILHKYDAVNFNKYTTYSCFILSLLTYLLFKLDSVFHATPCNVLYIFTSSMACFIFFFSLSIPLARRIWKSYLNHKGRLWKVVLDPFVGLWSYIYFVVPVVLVVIAGSLLGYFSHSQFRQGNASPSFFIVYIVIQTVAVLWLNGFPGTSLVERNQLQDQLHLNRLGLMSLTLYSMLTNHIGHLFAM